MQGYPRLENNKNVIRPVFRELIPHRNLTTCFVCGVCSNGFSALDIMEASRKFIGTAVLNNRKLQKKAIARRIL